MDDRQALDEYVSTGSQEAFRKLAGCYVDLVYSAARRQLNDAHQAEDATQAVFIILAKKARSIPPGALLSGWLYRATRYVCRNVVRQAARRAVHERNAAQMRHEAATNAVDSRAELKPLIDQAMSSLATKDRDALLMRYFQQQSISDVGVAMGISEEAARKRISRALERLSDFFKRKGITAPLAAIDAGLLAWAVEIAPGAVHQAAIASLGVASTAAASTLAKGAMFMMTLKTNIAVASAAVVLLVGTTAVVVVAANRPASVAAPVARDPSKATQLMQEGWQLWQQRQFAQAETRFSAAVKLDAKLTNAWNGLGWSQFNQGNDAAAQKSWEKVIALEPNHPAAENGLGWASFNRGDQAKAEQHWLASTKTPDSSAAWSGLAKVYLLEGKWDQAKTWASKLVDSGDESAKPLLEAAVAQQLSDELKAQISPPPPGAADVGKGWQLLNQNRVADAVALFRMAVSKDPKDGNALNGLGWALMRSGKAAEAQTQFEQALKIDPNNGGAINGVAILLKQRGKTDQAIDLWKKLDELTPTATNAGTYGLAQTYLEQKQYDKALPYYQRLAKDQPTDAAVQKGLQECEAHAGK